MLTTIIDIPGSRLDDLAYEFMCLLGYRLLPLGDFHSRIEIAANQSVDAGPISPGKICSNATYELSIWILQALMIRKFT